MTENEQGAFIENEYVIQIIAAGLSLMIIFLQGNPARLNHAPSDRYQSQFEGEIVDSLLGHGNRFIDHYSLSVWIIPNDNRFHEWVNWSGGHLRYKALY